MVERDRGRGGRRFGLGIIALTFLLSSPTKRTFGAEPVVWPAPFFRAMKVVVRMRGKSVDEMQEIEVSGNEYSMVVPDYHTTETLTLRRGRATVFHRDERTGVETTIADVTD